MRLVSSNSDTELARRRALATVEDTHRALAANIPRVIRGAGRASELTTQSAAFIEACVTFKEAAGVFPFTDDVERMLVLDDQSEWINKFGETERALHDAKHTIIRGALQVVASELLGQRPQATLGSHELSDGTRAHRRNAEGTATSDNEASYRGSMTE